MPSGTEETGLGRDAQATESAHALRSALRSARCVPEPVVETTKPAKPNCERVKANPVHVAAARELRDRYLEQFNSGVVLPAGKYEVAKRIETALQKSAPPSPSRLLDQAA